MKQTSTTPAPSFLPLFFRMKWQLGNNYLSQIKSHLWLHLAVGLLVLMMLVGGGSMVFKIVFNFLMRQEPFGPPLMDRLINMILLAFFSMLVFSNIIIMLTTTYISREVEFLFGLPVSHRRLFFAKLGESVVYSSWAFVVLAMPFFVALGQARHLGITFYLGSLVLLIPYIVIPAALGAMLAMILTVYFPPRRMILFTLGLMLVGAILAVVMQRHYDVRNMFLAGRDLPQLMKFMGIGEVIFLPSGWLGRGLLALERQQWSEVLLWGAALWSTAAMGLVTCDWLAGPLYYRGWSLTRNSGSARRKLKSGLYGAIDRLLCWMPRPIRAMVTKDLTVFGATRRSGAS